MGKKGREEQSKKGLKVYGWIDQVDLTKKPSSEQSWKESRTLVEWYWGTAFYRVGSNWSRGGNTHGMSEVLLREQDSNKNVLKVKISLFYF